jgi:hypothetical protein
MMRNQHMKSTIAFRVTRADALRLKAEAEERGRALSDLLREIVRGWLQPKPPDQQKDESDART